METCGWASDRAAAVRAELEAIAEVVTPVEIPRVCRDPDDDQILTIAVIGTGVLLSPGTRIYSRSAHMAASPSPPSPTSRHWRGAEKGGRLHATTRIVSTRFQQIHNARSSRHSNQFSTKPLFFNSVSRLLIRTSLGDQGSQVRVLSPRRTRNLSSRGGVARFAGRLRATGCCGLTRNDDFSCKRHHSPRLRPDAAAHSKRLWQLSAYIALTVFVVSVRVEVRQILAHRLPAVILEPESPRFLPMPREWLGPRCQPASRVPRQGTFRRLRHPRS